MTTRVVPFLTLLTLLHRSDGDISYMQESPRYAEKYDLCMPISDEDPEAMNIGQHWGAAVPAATKHIDLLQVTSPSSFFEFRTFDPEGAIFYGDTVQGQDWFILGLRKGRPEIQVRNALTPTSVSGCKQINDGQWHQVAVKSEEGNIVLYIDHNEIFRIWHHSVPVNESTGTILRIAVGGMMVNKSNLLVPMNLAMDGCIRSWNWMNQTRTWLTAPYNNMGSIKHCFKLLKRGSFFSGSGMAVFSSKDLAPGQDPMAEDWTLSLEMHIRPSKRTGFILALSDVSSHKKPVLSLRMKEQMFILELGSTVVTIDFPRGLCAGSHFVLRISKSKLSWRMDDNSRESPIPAQDYQALREAWHGQKGRLFVGGLPDLLKIFDSEMMVFFEGCLREVLVQGYLLDMDDALFKSDSIWSHSCPNTNMLDQQSWGQKKDN